MCIVLKIFGWNLLRGGSLQRSNMFLLRFSIVCNVSYMFQCILKLSNRWFVATKIGTLRKFGTTQAALPLTMGMEKNIRWFYAGLVCACCLQQFVVFSCLDSEFLHGCSLDKCECDHIHVGNIFKTWIYAIMVYTSYTEMSDTNIDRWFPTIWVLDCLTMYAFTLNQFAWMRWKSPIVATSLTSTWVCIGMPTCLHRGIENEFNPSSIIFELKSNRRSWNNIACRGAGGLWCGKMCVSEIPRPLHRQFQISFACNHCCTFDLTFQKTAQTLVSFYFPHHTPIRNQHLSFRSSISRHPIHVFII